MRAAQTLLIVAFSILIVLPGLQMRYRLIPEETLSGVGVPAKKPGLTRAGWWSGKFQSELETWFGEQIGFRGHAIRTDNQIGLSVFHEAFSKAADTPVLGRRMMIYEEHYLSAYDGVVLFRDRGLRKRARDLRRLQESLAERGIAFVLVIAPSKVSIYPEYLPKGVVQPDGLRPATAYERMLPMLRKEGVHVVDGHAVLEEEKGRSPHALFPPGGIHWNRYGAYLVVRRAFESLEQQLGRPLVGLGCRAVAEDDEPLHADQETDVADLMNAWHVGHADWKFPRPDLYAEGASDRFRPKVVVVGDSFWTLADAMIARSRLTARNDFFYYFNEFSRADSVNGRESAHPGDFFSGMTWDYVFSADAVIIEVIEAAIADAGYGFVQQAQKNLGPAPSPRPTP